MQGHLPILFFYCNLADFQQYKSNQLLNLIQKQNTYISQVWATIYSQTSSENLRNNKKRQKTNGWSWTEHFSKHCIMTYQATSSCIEYLYIPVQIASTGKIINFTPDIVTRVYDFFMFGTLLCSLKSVYKITTCFSAEGVLTALFKI